MKRTHKPVPLRRKTHASGWSECVPDPQWDVYCAVLRTAQDRGIEFALGGGFGLAAFTGGLKSTKDIDLYVVPEERDALIEIAIESGFQDYFDRVPYDRRWIHRRHLDDNILDIIWSMPNQRAHVDRRWVTEGPEIDLRGLRLRALPAEEMIWAKLYVLQRDRCDWTDIFNLLFAAGPSMHWDVLLERLEDDAPLLGAALTVFAWLCPGRAREFPEWIWERMNVLPPHGADRTAHRVALLDSREWFLPEIRRKKAS